jgi:lysozyme-like protein
MKLSPHEVADLVIKAGFSKTTIVPGTTDSEAIVAVAVSLAESSADTESISRTTAPITSDPKSVGNRDHGVFQLSGRWQYPKIQAANGNWRDPVVNTAIAYEIFKGAGRTFTSWSVFTKNANGVAPYEQYLPDARLAVAQPWTYTDPVLASIKQISDSMVKVTESLAKLTATMLDFNKKLEALDTKTSEMRKHFS